MPKNSKYRESGTGMAEVLVYVGLVAAAWFILYFIFHYIYTTKENRLARRAVAAEELAAKKKSGIELTARGPGGYQVRCSGIFGKKCKR